MRERAIKNPSGEGLINKCRDKVYYFFFPLFAAWVRADAATLLTAAGVFGLLNSLLALEATLGDVFSDFAIIFSFMFLIFAAWTLRGEGFPPPFTRLYPDWKCF